MTDKRPPDLSIVVSGIGSETFLQSALESIRGQAIDGHELIVVTDGTLASREVLVRSVFPAAVILRQRLRDRAAAFNSGLRVANGSLIAFLDGEDLWAPGALSKLLKGFADAPSAYMIQGAIKRFTATSGRPGAPAGRLDTGQAYFSSSNAGSLILRRRALDRPTLTDGSLPQNAAVDVQTLMEDAGGAKLVIPDTVLLHRQAAAESTQTSGWTVPDSPAPGVTGEPAAITVILTVRDGRRYLPTAMASVRQQSLRPVEILAVVGPSIDGTSAYLDEQADVRVINQDAEGLANARNQAIRLARHDLLAFLDHDDLWHPEKLATQARALSILERPGFSVTGFQTVEDADPQDPARTRPVRGGRVRLGLTPSALLAHREVFERVGDFDPALGNGCDTDWFARALVAGSPCAVATQVLLQKRIHANNLSRSPEQNRRDMFRIIAKRRPSSGTD